MTNQKVYEDRQRILTKNTHIRSLIMTSHVDDMLNDNQAGKFNSFI